MVLNRENRQFPESLSFSRSRFPVGRRFGYYHYGGLIRHTKVIDACVGFFISRRVVVELEHAGIIFDDVQKILRKGGKKPRYCWKKGCFVLLNSAISPSIFLFASPVAYFEAISSFESSRSAFSHTSICS